MQARPSLAPYNSPWRMSRQDLAQSRPLRQHGLHGSPPVRHFFREQTKPQPTVFTKHETRNTAFIPFTFSRWYLDNIVSSNCG